MASHHRQPPRRPRPQHRPQHSQRLLEHLPKQKKQRAERLGLGGRRDPLDRGQVGQEFGDLRLPHAARMPEPVEPHALPSFGAAISAWSADNFTQPNR